MCSGRHTQGSHTTINIDDGAGVGQRTRMGNVGNQASNLLGLYHLPRGLATVKLIALGHRDAMAKREALQVFLGLLCPL